MAMLRIKTVFSYLVLFSLGVVLSLPGCGGGGGAAGLTPLFRITTTTLPAGRTGQTVDVEIGVDGGCGGPYRMEVVGGTPPRGIQVDASTAGTGSAEVNQHRLIGLLLESGSFSFKVKITDTGCSPEFTAIQAYEWEIANGELTIVDSRPVSTPASAYQREGSYADVPALPEAVYGAFTSLELLAAGGTPPYRCALLDDPSDPDDGPLPLGVAIASNSLSLVGTPSSVGPDGRPFRLTFRVTDAAGTERVKKFQWAITTPAIVQVDSASLPEGTAGQRYDHQLVVLSGVPPFRFELVDDVPYTDSSEFVYGENKAPVFESETGFTVAASGVANNRLTVDGGAKGGSTAIYPAPDAAGPLGPMPPEGLYLEDGLVQPGRFRGVPQRVGDFTLRVHVASLLVPNAPGQHLFATHTLRIRASKDGVVMDPQVTNEKAFSDQAPYANLPELEMAVPYNPDGGPDGLSLLASGGVTGDGYIPAPHASQRAGAPMEAEGGYRWSIDWDPSNEGAQKPAGVGLLELGALLAEEPNAMRRQPAQVVRITCRDHQFPANTTSQLVNVSIGPDKIIVTESTRSWTGINNLTDSSLPFALNDNDMRIRRVEFSDTRGVLRNALDANDLASGHDVPSIAGLDTLPNPLGALLSGAAGGDAGLDLLRVTVNPTGWWDDVHGINPGGARAFQHSDPNVGNARRGQGGPSYSTHGNWQPSVSSVDLPDARNLAHDPRSGVYADGGRLYAFESDNRYGLFIIRSDASVYVPFAMLKNGGAGGGGFGDGLFENKVAAGQNSLLRTVQMTVSPNGRYAAIKIKRSPTYQLEYARDSRIVIVSLAGEKVFDGQTYKIVQPDAGATGSGSRWMPANSMALTDSNLYFLLSTQRYLPYQSWAGHYLMRYGIHGGASSASLLPSGGINGDWTQQANTPMQTTFQHWDLEPYRESSTSQGSRPYHRYWAEGGANFMENALAPTPFRVSRDGRAVAFLAGSNIFSTNHSLVYSNFAWVDFEGSGARQASFTRRHSTMGSGRGYAISSGPEEYGMWGRYNGPTTGLEISDNGLRMAFVYNTTTGSVPASYSASSSGHAFIRSRDDVICCSTTEQDAWANPDETIEKAVTASAFTGAHRWRFGALAFTKASDGLVFWAGAPALSATTTSATYQMSYQLTGSFYASGSLGSSDARVTSMLPTSAGGSPDGEGHLYTANTPFNPLSTSGLNNRYGAILPNGGFLSKNRSFMYISSYGALSSSDGTSGRLVGLNVDSLSPGSLNGHANGLGFAVQNWPFRRGFIAAYSYPGYAYRPGYLNAPNTTQGAGRQVMAKDTGWVFWGSGYQYGSAARSNSGTYGGPVHLTYQYGVYGYGGVGLYGFNAEVGGSVAQLNPSGSSSAGTRKRERLHYIEVADDGSSLVYVSSGEARYSRYDREQVVSVRGIKFDAVSGAMHAGFNRGSDARFLETTDGRAGEAMAITNQGRDVYYAFKAGAKDETQREMVRARFDDNGALTTKRFPGATGRLNVLYAGR